VRALLAIALLLPAAAFVACGGGGDDNDDESPTATSEASSPTRVVPSSESDAIAAEADSDPSLPGEWIDLQGIYGGPYPYGTPPPHQDGPIDYSAQGLPPAGGLHWGPSDGWTGPCSEDPATALNNCGPVPWGIYRAPWHAESLVHNMEHAGVVVWYNTDEQDVIDQLEDFALENLENGIQLVLAPYPDMDAETVAITIWSRRDVMAAGELDIGRLQEFIDVLYCRFDPEAFCN
jgi:hypothetical protein